MKVLITGSRSITSINFVFDKLDTYIDKEHDTIIHGGAPGVDSLAEGWCKANRVRSIIIRPIKPYKVYYLYRNVEMIGMCDKVLAFWDGKSRGTKFTYDYASDRGKTALMLEK